VDDFGAWLRDRACIAGVGETAYSRESGRSPDSLAVEACLHALRDAGIEPSEVDGLISYPGAVPVESVIGALGLTNITFATTVHMGGASMVAALGVAAVAVASGATRHVMLYVARNGSSETRIGDRVHAFAPTRFQSELEVPFGWTTPAQWYAMICQRHMHKYGTSTGQLASVAVQMRANAQLNPKAMMYGRPLSLDDYMKSEFIAEPYRKLDCCLETDGGAALLVTSAPGAASRSNPTVYIASVASAFPDSPDDLVNRSDWFECGLSKAAPRAFRMAQATPQDMDLALIYDCFTFELIHQLEEGGFCPRGQGGKFVEDGNIGLKGSLPVNPHGGMLSEAHMAGVNHVIEAVRQLRGQCEERQVTGASSAAVTGWGSFGNGAIAILRSQPR